MDELRIQYEIKPADYAEANSLVVKRSMGSWQMWSFLGAAVLLIMLPLTERAKDENWSYPFLVVPFAGFLTYYASLFVFPGWNARLHYSHTNLANSIFTAHFSMEHVKVEGQHVVWVTEWEGFRLIRESERMFLFYDGLTMYIFAKRYFGPEQIARVQQLIKQRWRPPGAASS